MAEEKEKENEKFLSRWSRLKRESKALPEKTPETPAPVLPPLDKLTPDSDFTGFMHPKVEDALRRAALKKLFSDPHFNVPDPFEAYSGDWTGGAPAVGTGLVDALDKAREVLLQDESEKKPATPAAEEIAAKDVAGNEEEAKEDGAGRQDA